MSESVTVPARFNGPLESGNGGYSAGALATFLDGAVEVSLRRPVPLDVPLRVERGEDGRVVAFAAEDLVAETMGHRLVPGAGELDLVGFVRALDTQVDAVPLTVEVLSDDLRAAGPNKAVRRSSNSVDFWK